MKTIYFIRHAKSSWDHPVADSERPLSQRGQDDAYYIGINLLERKLTVDGVFTSIANRAQSTARIITSKLGIAENQIIVSPDLYDFEGTSVLNFIKNLHSSYKKVLIFGHNPAFTEIVNNLGSVRFDNLPTCGVVAIQFHTESWDNLSKGETEFYILPKLLGHR